MNKPITLQVKETKEKLLKVIQESGLHVIALKPITDELKLEVDKHYQITEQKELEAYEKAQAEEKSSEVKTHDESKPIGE